MKSLSESQKLKFFIAINVFIFLTTAIAVPITLIFGSVASQKDNLPFAYWQHIATFTILSNIFLGIIALVSAILGVRSYKTHHELPRPLITWYLIAATSAVLTFLTVVFFLAPSRMLSGKNFFDMLIGPMFFLHFLNPVLAAIVFIFFANNKAKTTLRDRLLATIPGISYGLVYITCVSILRIVPDFYGLTFGGKYYLTGIVGLVFAGFIFAISSILSYCHNRQIAVK